MTEAVAWSLTIGKPAILPKVEKSVEVKVCKVVI